MSTVIKQLKQDLVTAEHSYKATLKSLSSVNSVIGRHNHELIMDKYDDVIDLRRAIETLEAS